MSLTTNIYIPPHKRNRKSSINNQLQKETKINSLEIKLIEIPETIIPQRVDVVTSVGNTFAMTDESIVNVVNGNIKTLVTSFYGEKSSENFKDDNIREITRIIVENRQKEEDDDFNEWIEHYDQELKQLYEICTDLIWFGEESRRVSGHKNFAVFQISYEKFIKLAYECTKTEFDRKKFKYTRSLI